MRLSITAMLALLGAATGCGSPLLLEQVENTGLGTPGASNKACSSENPSSAKGTPGTQIASQDTDGSLRNALECKGHVNKQHSVMGNMCE